MESKMYGNDTYAKDSIYRLLRFIRNYMAHPLSLAKTEEEEIVLLYLGVVDDVLEPNLRAIFLALFIKVYYAMKDYLNCWELYIPDLVPLEEILARERERKAMTTLLMALPENHLAKFHKMTDAKDMWEAIKSRFGGND
ncbi:xylulose kinase-1, partial [Tanacetum coccineum]